MIFHNIKNHTRTAVTAGRNSQQFYHLDIGNLASHIMDSILDVSSVVLRSKFSLVNIAAPQKGMAVGVLKNIPISIYTVDVELAFTFVINGQVNDADVSAKQYFPSFIHHLRRHIRLWEGEWVRSESSTGTRFITLLYRRRELEGTGVNNIIGIPMLKHLYEVIGVVTDNLLRYRLQYHRSTSDNHDNYYSSMDLEQMRVAGASNVNTMMRVKPTWMWALSPSVWRAHPNLIPTKFFSQYSVYFYLKFIHHHVRSSLLANKNSMGRIIGKRLGMILSEESTLLQVLLDSVKNVPENYKLEETYSSITTSLASSYVLGNFDRSQDDQIILKQIHTKLWD